jgi:WD40 repeat protein
VLGRRNTVIVFQPGGGGSVQEIELDGGKVIATWPDNSNVGAVPHSDDERLTIALMSEGDLRIRDHDTQTTRLVEADYLEPADGAFSPDGTLFAVASRIGYVRVWETATWQEVVTLRGFILGAAGVAFSPDGKRLAATDGSGNQAVRLWDTASWQEVLALRALGSVFSYLRFSPDGNRIWAVSTDSILHVWTAPSWEEIHRAGRGIPPSGTELSTLNAEVKATESGSAERRRDRDAPTLSAER